jgi:toxin-antitoxin system PIN domain toxin
MIYLADVNVWVALTSDKHVHHLTAKNWLQSLETEQIAFCRITQLGFLRLLTNSHVMNEDVLDPIHAWRVYDELCADPQVIYLPEQAGFNEHWRQIGDQMVGGSNAWTDAYLGAFAEHEDATVVTFDRRFKAVGNCDVLHLSA